MNIRWTAAVLLAFLAVALIAPWLAPADPQDQFDPARLANRTPGTPIDVTDGPPRFLLGSDSLGRDVLSRLLYGARTSLTVAVLTLVLSMTIGLAVGSVAGLTGGWLDTLLMRVVDGFMAFPRLFLVLLVAVVTPPSRWLVVLVLGATGWMFAARLVRGEVLKLKNREFVEAARTAGVGPVGLWLRHILPGVAATLGIEATLRVGEIILLESALSYLGLGVPPPTPSWGGMIADAAPYLHSAWWPLVFPALAIMLTVAGLSFLGDALEQRFDPRREAPARGLVSG